MRRQCTTPSDSDPPNSQPRSEYDPECAEYAPDVTGEAAEDATVATAAPAAAPAAEAADAAVAAEGNGTAEGAAPAPPAAATVSAEVEMAPAAAGVD